ncbi:hypothetical protein GIB67_038038, partial [Kingdonia uniflora]
KYQVSVLDLQYDRFINKIKDVPVVFVWAIGENLTCEKALQDPETFACKYKILPVIVRVILMDIVVIVSAVMKGIYISSMDVKM